MFDVPQDLETYVARKVATGQFRSVDELAIEALRVYRELEAKHAQLKSDVQAAVEESDRGLCEPLDIEAIKREVRSESLRQHERQ